MPANLHSAQPEPECVKKVESCKLHAGGGLETNNPDCVVLVQYLLAIHSCAVVFANCQKSGSV